MLRRGERYYIKVKLRLSIKIKKYYQSKLIKSIISSNFIANNFKTTAALMSKVYSLNKTAIHDVCFLSGRYKKSSRYLNVTRHELNNLCKTSKLVSYMVNSW